MSEKIKAAATLGHKFIARNGAMLMLLFALICAGVYLMGGDTVAWFSQNSLVSAHELQVKLEQQGVDVEYWYRKGAMADFEPIADWSEVFSEMLPGDRVELRAIYTNRRPEDYTASILLAPDADGETPLHLDTDGDGQRDTYYYFGTQLRVSEVTAENSNGTANAGGTLHSGSYLASQTGEVVGRPDPLTPVDLTVGEGLIIPGTPVNGSSTGRMTVTVTVEFVNFISVSQNPYQGFGTSDAGEQCYRYLVAALG